MGSSKIYVGNLPYDMTENDLRKSFSKYGVIDEVKLLIDFNTGRSKGFAFISFTDVVACDKAVEAANGLEIGGRRLKVNLARENAGGRGERAGRRPQHNYTH